MTLQLGDIAPDFEAETTEGKIKFHDYIDGSWAVLVSHPKDFTPVCTTELGSMAKLKHEFDKRGVKLIGISVDSVEDHQRWKNDIKDVTGAQVNYPMIGDSNLTVAKLYGMIHPNASGDAKGRTAADNSTVRNGLHHRAGQEDQAAPHLSHDHRAQFPGNSPGDRFPAIDRHQIRGNPCRLETGRGCDHSGVRIG